jgi:bifunctional DNase/RNase
VEAMVEMELVGVRLELPANTPIVLLREQAGQRRVLPIYIGGPEAAAIAYALEGVQSPRPLTHDLFKDVLDELGVRLARVVVTDMREHTYYAELHLDRAGSTSVVSSRPSDSIALAVRTGSPIFADEGLLDEYGQIEADEEPEAEEGQQEEILEEFRDFIANVNPEDFDRS